jgi:hypothetical protein
VGGDSSFLLDLFTNVGMAGVFIFLYLDERKERRAAQTLNNQLLERVLPLVADATTTLERVQQSQTALKRAEASELENQLHEMVLELRKVRGEPS